MIARSWRFKSSLPHQYFSDITPASAGVIFLVEVDGISCSVVVLLFPRPESGDFVTILSSKSISSTDSAACRIFSSLTRPYTFMVMSGVECRACSCAVFTFAPESSNEIDIGGAECMEVKVALVSDGRNPGRFQILFKHRRRVLRHVQERVCRWRLLAFPLSLLAICAVVMGTNLSRVYKRRQTRHNCSRNHLIAFLADLVDFLFNVDGAALPVEVAWFELAQFVLPQPGASRHFAQKPPMRGAIPKQLVFCRLSEARRIDHWGINYSWRFS